MVVVEKSRKERVADGLRALEKRGHPVPVALITNMPNYDDKICGLPVWRGDFEIDDTWFVCDIDIIPVWEEFDVPAMEMTIIFFKGFEGE